MSDYIKKHKSGIIGTIIFHIVIAGIFMFFGYTTPLPLPAEEGILINFGDSDEGFGNEDPQLSESVQQEVAEEIQESVEESTPSPTEEGAITQDYEEAPAIEEQGKKEEKKETKTEIKPEPPKEEVKEVKVERKVNEQALFPGRKRNSDSSSSEGETQGDKNQGSATGSVDSQDHAGGNSTGTNGTSFSLEGRNPTEALPIPDYNYQIEGKVVVEITVDKYGNVNSANPGIKGSTTLDANLLAAAKRAALKAKFDKKPDAPAYQKGTITYFFRLQQ
ncbi:MAG: TonB family protein [Bacteroidales bacterium]|nr:TonB family protein [Bacteroidales bacterium]